MSTQFKEFRRKVSLRVGRGDGLAMLATDEGINEAHKVIARVIDAEELKVLDTTHAATTAEQKLYHLTNDLDLVRVKDILTIRYMDEELSTKLIFIPTRELDTKLPYTEIVDSGTPTHYTRRGDYIELFRTPDEAKPLYIFHTQWPKTLVSETDETSYSDLDDVIVTLATEIATAILDKTGMTNWTQRAMSYLKVAVSDTLSQPDSLRVARPFMADQSNYTGEYWTDPFIKRNP